MDIHTEDPRQKCLHVHNPDQSRKPNFWECIFRFPE
jgi:hypothetical protein